MTPYICWKQDDVPYIMNTDADYTPDHIFAAVHTPVKIKKKLNDQDGEEGIPYTQEVLLQDFTNSGNRHLIVPILGVSGSGKSHLVHWLKTHIPSIPGEQEVLLIPKAGTNLKSILFLLLKNREGAKFDEYRRRLQQTTQHLDAAAGRVRLLDRLAQQITSLDIAYYQDTLGEQYPADLLQLVKSSLPNLLYDPHFRNEYWLQEKGVIARLYKLALGTNERERLDDRRRFDLGDLPVEMDDYMAAGEAAKKFVRVLIGSKDVQEVCIALLNASLNEAIRDLLIGGEDLTELMMDVRRQLYQEGVTLILLIEDFAKMQGIDGAVLEAVIQQSSPADDHPLCTIRTALACTNGYYEKLPETFRTRVNFTIWVEYNEENPSNYTSFVAHYLNAARLGAKQLEEDFHEFSTQLNHHEWKVTNACTSCAYRTPCHEAFGEYEGVGLYPFNKSAAQNLYHRLGYRSFTPRNFIGKTIKEVMYRFAPGIRDGSFPNQKLLREFGEGRVSRLMAAQQQTINSTYGEAIAERIFPLMEFWSDSQSSINQIHKGIYEAFDLPVITEIPGVSPSSLPKQNNTLPEAPTQVEEPVTSETYPSIFYALDNWRNGDSLDQEPRRELRKYLFDAITNYINWNEIGLDRSEFTSTNFRAATYLFNPDNIHFLTRGEKGTDAGAMLMLPLEEVERLTTTMALQALALYNTYGSWIFDSNGAYFLAFAKHLKQWSDHVVKKLTTFSTENKDWHPLQGIVQGMYFSARLAGNIKHDDTDLAEIWENMHEKISFKHPEIRSIRFRQLTEQLEKHITSLHHQLKVHALCAKGEGGSVVYFDLTKVFPALEEVHNKGKIVYTTPRGVVKRYGFLEELDKQFDKLESALESEASTIETHTNRVLELLGEPEQLKNTFAQLDVAFQEVERGFGHALARDKYEGVISFLRKGSSKLENPLRNALHVKILASEEKKNIKALTSRIGRADFLKILNESSLSANDAFELLSRVQARIAESMDSKKTASSGSLEDSIQQIDSALNTLVKLGNKLHHLKREE